MNLPSLKERLDRREVVAGTWIQAIGSRVIVELIAQAGFDFVYIDMEHSAFSLETVSDLCVAALRLGLAPIVRPEGIQPNLVRRPLDGGAMGVLVPHVDTPGQIRDVINWAKYPPVGSRGFAASSPYTGYRRVEAGNYMAEMNRHILVLAQIESQEAVNNLDAILSLPGLDGAVVGRYDLSQDLGIPGRVDDPRIHESVELVIAGCRRRNLVPGLLVSSVEEGEKWIRRGIRMVAFANEASLLQGAYRGVADRLHSATPKG